MQAIARVNRVFKDKPGGLIVDYVGLLYDLKYAMADYTQNGGRGNPLDYNDEAVALMLEKYEIVQDLFMALTICESSQFPQKKNLESLERERILFSHKAVPETKEPRKRSVSFSM